jgi:hypothetical protein
MECRAVLRGRLLTTFAEWSGRGWGKGRRGKNTTAHKVPGYSTHCNLERLWEAVCCCDLHGWSWQWAAERLRVVLGTRELQGAPLEALGLGNSDYSSYIITTFCGIVCGWVFLLLQATEIYSLKVLESRSLMSRASRPCSIWSLWVLPSSPSRHPRCPWLSTASFHVCFCAHRDMTQSRVSDSHAVL